MTKLKAFADWEIDEAQMMISVWDVIENIVGKGVNTPFSHKVIIKLLQGH